MQSSPELTECDREPIHHIAAVQDFGGLIAVNSDWMIAHRSVNCESMLKLSELPAPGSRLAECFSPRAIELLKRSVGKLSSDDAVERLFGVALTNNGPLMDVAVHVSDSTIIIEFERHAAHEYADHLGIIGPVLSQLDPIDNLDELCTKAAKLARDMLGYDRVMVYKFHPDQSGEVVAEDRRDDLEPYLGLRYPREDIPQQARDLFKRNRMRVIADMDADPVPIEPAIGVNKRPLDLSMSMLRSHSKMHVEYMRNMGVSASLAIAIVTQDKLWGMVSCHNYKPRVPAYSLRTVAEMFSQMFSLMVDRIASGKANTMRAKAQLLHERLMVRLANGESLFDNLELIGDQLSGLIQHDGLSAFFDGQYKTIGVAPDQVGFHALTPTLATMPISKVVSMNCLAEFIPDARKFQSTVTGALILPISRSPRDYLVLWRRPLSQTITWAGDPAKAIAPEGERLQPRGSFAAWVETVEGCSEDWTADEVQVAESLRTTLLEVILRMSDEASRERARAQEQQELLISELNHRVRNILNLIRSLVAQSQHDAHSVASFANIIGGRISALASAHDNITRENWAPAPLSKLFETELAAYLNDKRERFNILGDEVLIGPEAYTVLALVIHELVTNSAKYGSLCDRSGQLDVTFERDTFGDLKILWRERGGPPVKSPTRRGFGSTIIERSIPYELKGEAELRFKLSGLEADFLIPKRYIVPVSEKMETANENDAADEGMREDGGSSTPVEALPQHVLVVEDSMIIALDTEENLKRVGVKNIDVASSVEGAISAIERRVPDFAIVDFNLGIESSEPVARSLKDRGVRFVLATGYAEMADQIDQFGADGLLRKPYGLTEIEELMNDWNSGPTSETTAIPASENESTATKSAG
ncbi:HWE histidine kinase domain-containing protein [Erythrobacter sp. YT30]|uniref:HWE histidine kinase domain-containing protein n=1 Tax=Erythrobacter sp. YT30 TaxID=1735012 RepID=UPI001F1AC54F|nr:HWE histidine kinase domain-containing protein [Erythrobacter sp. YT30]